jgi:hypothetical protein
MKKLILVIVSSIFALLLGELVLKLFFPLAVKTDHNKIFCQYDSLLGWTKIPNYEGFHITEEYKVKESFNSKGLRGSEYNYNKTGKEKRILIFGFIYRSIYG